MKNSNKSIKIIAVMLISIFIYVGIAVYTQLQVGIELSPTLTFCFFTAMCVEFVQLAGIKKAKTKNKSNAIPTDAVGFAKKITEVLDDISGDEDGEEDEKDAEEDVCQSETQTVSEKDIPYEFEFKED